MKRCVKSLLILPPLLLCGLAVCLSRAHPGVETAVIPAATEEERLHWLASQGLQAQELSSRCVTIPSEFSGTYACYAALQEQQHLPLTAHAGAQAVCITYEVTDCEPPLYAELLTAEGLLIGAQCYHPEEGIILDMQGKAVPVPEEGS